MARRAADPRVASVATPTAGIVVYGDLDARSGGYRYDRELADHLRERGWKLEVVSLPERPWSLPAASAPGLAARLEACDVVVADAYCAPSLYCTIRGLETPVVALVHYLRSAAGGDERRGWVDQPVERAFLAAADAFVYNSEPTRRAVEQLCADPVESPGDDDGPASVAASPAVVAPPAGDRLGSGPAFTADAGRPDPFRVVAVGTVTPRKGIDTLVRGLSRLAGVDWRLRVVGETATDPEHVAALRALADRLGVASAVTFTGRVSDAALRAALRRAHVLAVPSRYEPFGIVYVEGMAFGLPAIASTNGGASDVVDGENGALVPPADPDAVADAIEPLATDPARLARASRAARETAAAHPTWTATCDRIRRFLAAIVDDR